MKSYRGCCAKTTPASDRSARLVSEKQRRRRIFTVDLKERRTHESYTIPACALTAAQRSLARSNLPRAYSPGSRLITFSQLLLSTGAPVGRRNCSVVIDQVGHRHRPTPYCLRRVVPDHNGVVDLARLQVGLYLGPAFAVHGDPDCCEAVVSVFFLKFYDFRYFFLATFTPRGPEVQLHHFPFERGDLDVLPPRMLQKEVRRRLPVDQGLPGRRPQWRVHAPAGELLAEAQGERAWLGKRHQAKTHRKGWHRGPAPSRQFSFVPGALLFRPLEHSFCIRLALFVNTECGQFFVDPLVQVQSSFLSIAFYVLLRNACCARRSSLPIVVGFRSRESTIVHSGNHGFAAPAIPLGVIRAAQGWRGLFLGLPRPSESPRASAPFS